MSEDKKLAVVTCPLCGGEVTICFGGVGFNCNNEGCHAVFRFDGLTEAEAIARFSARPENIEARMWSKLKIVLHEEYNKIDPKDRYDLVKEKVFDDVLYCHMPEIEKELSHDRDLS